MLARTLDFDIIHSHDWLTYPAGIHAKQVTGKPLVIHVHATEYDRSRGKPNPTVYGIERDGMTHADHIITVSNAAEVVGAHVVEVGVYVVAEAVVQVGVHYASDARLYVVAVHADAYLRVFGMSGVAYIDRMLIGFEDEGRPRSRTGSRLRS